MAKIPSYSNMPEIIKFLTTKVIEYNTNSKFFLPFSDMFSAETDD